MHTWHDMQHTKKFCGDQNCIVYKQNMQLEILYWNYAKTLALKKGKIVKIYPKKS